MSTSNVLRNAGKRMPKPALTFLFVIMPFSAFADKLDAAKSPFDWGVLVSNSDIANRIDPKESSFTYKDVMVNALLDNGLKNEQLGLKCSFNFDKEMDLAPQPLPPTYKERIWISCNVNGVRIGMNAVGCSYNPSNPSKYDFDGNGPTFEKGNDTVHISVTCSTKKSALDRKPTK